MRACKAVSLLLPLLVGSSSGCGTPKAEPLAEPRLFNHGRTRNYARGMSVGAGDSVRYVTLRGPGRDSSGALRSHVAVTRWRDGAWSDPAPLQLFGLSAATRDPLIAPDGARLYFASTARPGAREEQRAFQIWYAEAREEGWGEPVFAHALNVASEASVAAVTRAGAVYVVATDTGATGRSRILRAQPGPGGFSAPAPLAEWSSEASDTWVAVDQDESVAILARSPMPDSIVLVLSVRDGDRWTPPEPIAFRGANWLRPYAWRFPFITHDRGALVLTSGTRVFDLPLRDLLALRAPRIPVATYQPYPVPPLAPDEAELFHPLELRATNGIAFTRNLDTLYHSQWLVLPGDSGPVLGLRIRESRFLDRGWTAAVPAPFSEPPDAAMPEELHPVFSPDRQTLYFDARRGPDGHVARGGNDVWRVRRTPAGDWSVRESLLGTNGDFNDEHVSLTHGGAIYFISDRPGGLGSGDIMVLRRGNETPDAPIHVTELNSPVAENDLFVDPDERFLLFNRYFPATRELDVFISFRRGGGWSAPRALARVNTVADWELTPVVSPDGEYLFVEISGVLVRWRLHEVLTAEERALLAAGADPLPRSERGR